jgi:hypothetical protein
MIILSVTWYAWALLRSDANPYWNVINIPSTITQLYNNWNWHSELRRISFYNRRLFFFLSMHDFLKRSAKGMFPLMEAGVPLHSFRNSFIPGALVMVKFRRTFFSTADWLVNFMVVRRKMLANCAGSCLRWQNHITRTKTNELYV